MLVISSLDLMSDTGTEHGLNALPLMWQVQALQTSRPQPYFGPVHAQQVAQHPEQAEVVLAVHADLLAVEDEAVSGHQNTSLRPSVGDGGIGGTVGSGSNPSGRLWLIGKLVGSLPVARA